MCNRVCWTVLSFMTLAGVAGAAEGFVSVKDGRFVDDAGRHVILNGINVGGKHKRTDYVSWHGPEEFARMKEWGFNCVRLLIIWAAIEPECGKYDEAFLRRIDERIAWAKANGLYVLVDMHQDLWGEKVPGGDGAPAWASLDGGRKHVHMSDHWGDAYLTSPMIQTCFDAFWANKPGPDGVGIQDRFALAWRHVAKRYANEPAVIGYDLLNEPFPGTPMLMMTARMAVKLGELLGPEFASDGPAGLMGLLTDRQARLKVYQALQDVEKFRALVDAPGPIVKHFDRTKLSSMYARVAKAIRQVDKRHILFLEPSLSANIGTVGDLKPVTGPDGKPDPLQAFAPHAYDLVTETPGAGAPSTERMELILRRLASRARELRMPMVLGEWGAFQNRRAMPVTRLTIRILEESLSGTTFWYFSNGIDRKEHFKMLRRPYPMAMAGTLASCRLDPSTGVFECTWKDDPAAKQPSRIYIPATWYPAGCDVTIKPLGQGHRFEPINGNKRNGYLTIPPLARPAERHLVIRAEK